MKRYSDELTAHCGGGGVLSAVQRILIGRAARLALQIELMDEKALAAGKMADGNARMYLAWTNALRLTLRELGLKPVTERPGAALDAHIAKLRTEASA